MHLTDIIIFSLKCIRCHNNISPPGIISAMITVKWKIWSCNSPTSKNKRKTHHIDYLITFMPTPCITLFLALDLDLGSHLASAPLQWPPHNSHCFWISLQVILALLASLKHLVPHFQLLLAGSNTRMQQMYNSEILLRSLPEAIHSYILLV